MTREEAQTLVKTHGSAYRAALAAGIPKSTFYDLVNGVTRNQRAPAAPAAPHSGKARSLSEFRQTFDKDLIVPKKVREGLRLLGRQGWAWEAEFAKLSGLTLSDLGNYRAAFVDHVVTVKERRAWAGSKDTADQMRSMI